MVDGLKDGQDVVLEGRLKMNSVTRQDGTKEKQPELTASKIHHLTPVKQLKSEKDEVNPLPNDKNISQNNSWDSSPLVPEVDEIPF